MTLVSSGRTRSIDPEGYKFVFNINSVNDFEKIKSYDHTASLFKNNYRNNNNFLKTNVLMLDFDEKTLSIDDFINKHKEIEFYLATSKSHNKEKNGKVEPRYHIYLPIPLIDDYEKYSGMIKATQKYFESCDTACKDPSRYFNGNPEAEIFYNGGDCILRYILEIYKNLKIEKDEKVETEKSNNAIHKYFIENSKPMFKDEYYKKIIYKELNTNDHEKGARSNFFTHLTGVCRIRNVPTKYIYFANNFVGLPEKEIDAIVSRYYKEDTNE